MRHRILGYSLFGLVAVLLGQGVATAQAPPPPAAPAGDASRQVQVSPQDQLAQSEAYLSAMEAVRSGVRRELGEARQQRDVVKTLCLNDKLNQVDVALRSAGERKRGLESAAGRGDSDLSSHEFTILSVLNSRVKQLDAEAKQCIGKEIGFVGESSNTMDVDPGMPIEDPSEHQTVPTIIEPPNCATCFR